MISNNLYITFKQCDTLYTNFRLRDRILLVNEIVVFVIAIVLALLGTDLFIYDIKSFVLFEIYWYKIGIYDIVVALVFVAYYGIIFFCSWRWNGIDDDIKYCRLTIIDNIDSSSVLINKELVKFNAERVLKYFCGMRDVFCGARKKAFWLLILDVVNLIFVCLIIKGKDFFVFFEFVTVYFGVLLQQFCIFNDYNCSINCLYAIDKSLKQCSNKNEIYKSVFMQCLATLYNKHCIKSLVRKGLENKIFRVDSFII